MYTEGEARSALVARSLLRVGRTLIGCYFRTLTSGSALIVASPFSVAINGSRRNRNELGAGAAAPRQPALNQQSAKALRVARIKASAWVRSSITISFSGGGTIL